MSACAFPACPTASTERNRAGQDVCRGHALVVVTGSWVVQCAKEE